MKERKKNQNRSVETTSKRIFIVFGKICTDSQYGEEGRGKSEVKTSVG